MDGRSEEEAHSLLRKEQHALQVHVQGCATGRVLDGIPRTHCQKAKWPTPSEQIQNQRTRNIRSHPGHSHTHLPGSPPTQQRQQWQES